VHIIDGKKYHENGHWGMDLYSNNRDIYIPINGIITYMDYGSTYGNSIIVENFSGTERWRLAHLEGFSKNLWLYDEVESGEYAGKLGNTGFSTGAHLHLSLEYNIAGKWIFANPASRIDLKKLNG
jgi:murein DD-endopeptidase MepM/ murein hydrolase activator NlpD